MDELASRSLVADLVGCDGERSPAGALPDFEPVFVNPAPVGPDHLLVHKTMRRFPRGDLAPPAKRQTAKAQTIVNADAALHEDLVVGENPEAKPGRGQEFQIPGVRKEAENTVERRRQGDGTSKDSHRS